MIALRQFRSARPRCACSRRWATRPISRSTCCASCRRRCAASAWSIDQIYAIGYRSLTIILASGFAVGCVLALQMYYALVPFGAAESLGLVVNLSLVRELGPVVTALLFAGRAGTALTAEIGLMKAGEQLSAMELMAVDPRSRVLAPRFLAGIVSMPILAILYSAVGILGAWLIAVAADRRGPGQLLVDHAVEGRRHARHRQRHRQVASCSA